jgi:hypothetical protein
MHASNDNVTPSRSFFTKYLFASCDCRQATATPLSWLVVLSALLFSIGDWWAAPLLVVVAMVLFSATFYVLRIVQG